MATGSFSSRLAGSFEPPPSPLFLRKIFHSWDLGVDLMCAYKDRFTGGVFGGGFCQVGWSGSRGLGE